MDSTAVLDSALFQLTPTRTRFDLILFCESKKEKLASGLFEPFISHLKFARDEICRGGYSISLHPPTSHSSWFTKSTFERFVRFVNSPAILERFIGLEKEISHIERSIQANENVNATGSKIHENVNLRKSNESSKLQNEFEERHEGAEEENSKIQLQRLLETRRTLLRREQAMAYARGVVAGFEIDGMDDLISFSDAFGASRLREACNDYKELWKKKHGDGLWMAELAAVKACDPSDISFISSSGIVLTNEVAALSLNVTDSTPSNAGSGTKAFQAPTPWPNHVPQYYYPFQGYPYPPMHPHQNTGNMSWPPKGKSYKKKGNEEFESDVSSETSESDSGSDNSASSLEDQGKRHSRSSNNYRKSAKHRKKSSKTVIIRNINYITPDGRNEDVEGNEVTDNISVKESVDAAIELLSEEKRVAARQGCSTDDMINRSTGERRINENWDAFQNILMSHEEKSVDKAKNLSSMDVREEDYTLRSSIKGAKSEGLQMKNKVPVDFESEEGACRLPRMMNSADEFMILPKRSEITGNGSKDMNYAGGAENSVIKSGKGEDWFVAHHETNPQRYERSSDDCILTSEGSCNARIDQNKKREFVDDSFMVQSSFTGDDLCESRWKSDISVAADLALASRMENGKANTQHEMREPNDLFMILERNSEPVDYSLAFDHGIDLSAVEANARVSSTRSSQEEDKIGSSGEKKNNAKNTDARAKSRVPGRSIISKTAKRPSVGSRTMAQKSKLEKEEEMRKRIEELVRERQKRIAERTAMDASRRASVCSTTGKGSASRGRAFMKA